MKSSCRIVSHADGEDDTMQPCQRLRSSRRVPCQSSKAVDPANAARNHPTAWQQDNASFRFFQRDDRQMHPFLPRRVCSVLACVSLIDDGECDRIWRDMLHVLCQRTDLRAVLRIGSSALDGKQMPQCIDGTMDLAPFLALLAVKTCTRTAFAA